MASSEHDNETTALAARVRKLTTTVNVLTLVCLLMVLWLLGIKYSITNKCVNKIRFTYSQGVEPTICEAVRPNSTKW